MAEKTIKTRIINKHGALADWLNSSTILKEGEIALAYVETTKPDGQGGTYTIPTYLMKVGDNEHTFSELEWVAAPASDVYAWAKKENLALSDIPMADVVDELKKTFYTEAEVNAELAKKSDSTHNHTITVTATDDDVVVLTGSNESKAANVKLTASHANSGVTAGTYRSVTVNVKGHVTAGTNPTTISGYGITDAYTKTEVNAELAKKSDVHNHPYLSNTVKYAGSSSAGGAATSANKVNKSVTFKATDGATAGSTFDGSTAVTVSYATVGAAPASHTHDDRYFTEDEVTAELAKKSNTGHTHDDRYYTETEVDNKIAAAVSSALKYKGTKATTGELPTSGNATGDVWNITNACAASDSLPKVNAGDNVAWNGTSWDVLAGTVDLSNYYNKSEVNAELAKKSDTHNHPYLSNTTKYAGSSTQGGAATSANKVNKSVTFKATGGATAGSAFDGSAAVTVDYSTVGAAPASHTHDDRYYTESEVTANFAAKNHTHDVSIATSTGTNELTLAHGAKYALTAGGQSFVFTMPSDNNTHNTSKNIVGASATATANATATNGNVYLNHLEQSSVTSSHKISGSGATSVSADASGNITITSQNTAHSHSAGVGLVGSGSSGTSGGTYDYKVALVNETKASNASSYTAGAASKFYSVQLDKDGKLAVNVPWSDTNTHLVTRIYAGASGAAANAAATNPYIKVTDDNTYRNQIQLKGANGTKVSSDANGVVTVEALPATNDSGETMTYIFDCGGPND